jgi:hypothetical protein
VQFVSFAALRKYGLSFCGVLLCGGRVAIRWLVELGLKSDCHLSRFEHEQFGVRLAV